MPYYVIEKSFAFSASHQLYGLRDGHPCGRLHGHNYEVKVRLSSDALDEHGFVYDYGDLAPIKDFLDNNLDHRHVNDEWQGNPTAEHMAERIGVMAQGLLSLPQGVELSIGVSETPKTWAWWMP